MRLFIKILNIVFLAVHCKKRCRKHLFRAFFLQNASDSFECCSCGHHVVDNAYPLRNRRKSVLHKIRRTDGFKPPVPAKGFLLHGTFSLKDSINRKSISMLKENRKFLDLVPAFLFYFSGPRWKISSSLTFKSFEKKGERERSHSSFHRQRSSVFQSL